jgi:2-polyprenyl-6-methoxyphenol hydroxylase-like FAD-dependent oxidoreductase
MSRPLIELVARQRVQQHPNITLRQRCRVRELVASADRSAVIAVRCENADGKSEALPADLVVDASGRGSLTHGLLESIGQEQPEETVIGVDFGYATTIFAIPNDSPSDWKGVLTLPEAPESSRGGLMLPLEGGERWIVGVGGGRYGEKPPRGFRRVPSPSFRLCEQASH